MWCTTCCLHLLLPLHKIAPTLQVEPSEGGVVFQYLCQHAAPSAPTLFPAQLSNVWNMPISGGGGGGWWVTGAGGICHNIPSLAPFSESS